ncbi:peroxiredoxin family protein [Cytobacillus sp. FJAT-54145]|uniref:Peroxiredoxin family protein n=1 Tax=Cytobacillus spartinae TaxID=3299023 RepID=A0ABW6K6Y1_9BACI
MCQQQLVQLHENLDKLEGIDANMYVISKDTPEQQLELYNALKEQYGTSLPIISDPKLEMAEVFDVKNEDVYFRGYGILDTDGKVVFKTVNDHWGELFDETVEEIKSELGNM